MTNEFGRPIVLSGEFPQIGFLSDWPCQIPKLVCDFATCHTAAGWVLKFDLFDAQVPRLPAIWRQSPDAHLGTVLAPRKLGKGEEDVKDDTFKPFHWSLVGTQSHPAELGQQPEASLAWGSAMATAKRRQPVPRPCY